MSQRFHKGQKIVCTTPTWYLRGTDELAPGPRKDEVVTCDGYDEGKPNYLYLVEYAAMDADGDYNSYKQNGFAPIPRVDAKESLLSTFKEIKEGADVPVRVKELI